MEGSGELSKVLKHDLQKETGRCGSVENNRDGKLARVLTGSISGVELRGSNEAVRVSLSCSLNPIGKDLMFSDCS